ncbi:DUF2628 domain-containing protein [Ameyamaea chiangmaiensis]|uniref:DUF2628 domain-containing protein n=1 Tax=Ameyamaea chiangmaiensis TaxID=442969 RepID=A0A850PIL4_9PROT|nr:DUF2628 domain-containing protein [Ameyamaea chiangmaiensis]MBS4076658.1 DUF2628 domain-containing protein [Ameyamaea chiangmaiensis]NVN42066.1 DUF2628 domain-containing protein [Ameyamaea chiangmaiensis]
MTIFPERHELVTQLETAEFSAFCRVGSSSLRLHQHIRAPIWAALVFSFAWFYWRRLYLVGSLMLMLPVLISTLDIYGRGPLAVNGALVVGCLVLPPFMARRLYAIAFLQRSNRASRLGLSTSNRIAYLEAAGGTSWLGGLLAGGMWVAFAVAILHSLLPHLGGVFLP